MGVAPMLCRPRADGRPLEARYVTRTQALPFPTSPQAEEGRVQALGPHSRRRRRLNRLQVADPPLAALAVRKPLCLGSSSPFHVSRKSSRAAAGPGPGSINLVPLRADCCCGERPRRAARPQRSQSGVLRFTGRIFLLPSCLGLLILLERQKTF